MKNYLENPNKNLLRAVFLTGSILSSISFAQAQSVEFTGSNEIIRNGCYTVTEIPNTCVGQIREALPDFNATSHSFPLDGSNGVIIGTNLTDGHEGPQLSGNVKIRGGGTIDSAYLYIGYEKNGSGKIEIEGSGSIWKAYSDSIVGHYGYGRLYVMEGAQYIQVNPDYFYIGRKISSLGDVSVSGVDPANGNRSTLITKSKMYVGNAGGANLFVSMGALVSVGDTMSISEELLGGSGVFVRGFNREYEYPSTLQVNNNDLLVGAHGEGNIAIDLGGRVDVQGGIFIGKEATGEGEIYVANALTDADIRTTVNSNTLTIGDQGRGIAEVIYGALVNTNNFYLAYAEKSTAILSIRAREGVLNYKATINVNNDTNIGVSGEALAIISPGGLLNVKNNLGIGTELVGDGTLNVDSEGAEVVVGGTTTVGKNGTGTLTLSDGGVLKSNTVVVAETDTAKGVVNIGTGNHNGTINTSTISGGMGDATINFNYINHVDFTPTITGNINVNQINTSRTTLSAKSDYSGLTTISAGALRAGGADVFSGNSDYLVELNGMLDLNGYSQTIASLDNAGLIRAGGAGGAVIKIRNSYTGNGGLIELNTVLGDDNSLTDKLIVDETKGISFIRVRNAGGAGARTSDGIQLIEVVNKSDATFSLLGDYIFQGDQAVVGGAYAYRLYQGATSASDAGHWYLRSTLASADPVDPVDPVDPGEREAPLYQPGVPVYESYAQSLLNLNSLNTLRQRIGNRYWARNGNRVISDTAQHYAPTEEASTHMAGNGIWGRIEGVHNKLDPKITSSGADYSQNIFRVQVGVDMLLSENVDGMLMGGVYAHYVHGKTKVRSIYGDGTISSDGYGFGATLTWQDNEGFYADGQAQATWYDSKLVSALVNKSLITGNKGFGYAFSLETGKRFAMTPKWSLTPQAQLSYSNVDFDSFRDIWNAHVSLDKGHRLEGRLGLALDYASSWKNDAGLTNRAHMYGIANLYYGFNEGTRVNVSNTRISQKQERLWGGLGVGGSYSWNDDKYSLYGEGLANTGLNGFGNSYTVKGSIGLRVKW